MSDRKYLWTLFACIALAAALFASCQPVQQTSNTSSNAAANQSTPSPSPSATATPEKENVSITLPVLDALLRDESFVAEVKSSVGLSDADIEKLRSEIAGGMNGLDEGDNPRRSSRRSAQSATELVGKVLGPQQASRFIAFAQDQWSKGDSSTASNSIPTDTRVVVNIPAFRMDIFDHGQIVRSYKIGVGYPEFPLPTGIRTAKEIIINPEWTPPDEPWVKGKVKPLEKVDAGSKLNPLGVIKIPIGSPSLIHGGKLAARLGNFASHGCVGLTDRQVEDFAVRLSDIGAKSITLDEIKSFEKAKTETKKISLQQPVEVELRYETIVVENGTLKIFRDIYERGTNTRENLDRVLQANGTSFDQLDVATQAKIEAALKDMGTDAGGAPVNAGASANANTNANSESAKVTKTIKGKKEVDIPIAALAGKGYPAPVDLMAN